MCRFEVKFESSSKDNLMRLYNVLENAGYRIGKFISWNYMRVTEKNVQEPPAADPAKPVPENHLMRGRS